MLKIFQHSMPVKSPVKYAIMLVLVFLSATNIVESVYAQHDETGVIQAGPGQIVQLGDKLARAKLKNVQTVLVKMEAAGGDAVLALYQAMLSGDLFYVKDASSVSGNAALRRLVIASKTENRTYLLQDAITLDSLGERTKKQIKKVRSNNKLRGYLRSAIARLTLNSEQPEIRKSAVENMLDSLDSKSIPYLEKAREQESESDIIELIDVAIALNVLRTSEDVDLRLQAIETVQQSLRPVVRNSLTQLLEQDEQSAFIEPNAPIRAKAREALDDFQNKLDFYGLLETIFFGLSLGSVLLLVATGLAITFGVMGVINMAHGELIMLGAYTTYVVQLWMPNNIEYSVLVAIPVAFIVSGMVGIAIERGVIRHLQGRPLETLLATFGISLILQQAVRSMFSPLNRQVATPDWMGGSLEFNAVFSITYNRLYILIFALLVFFALQLIMKKTSLGLYVRAVSQNRDMAKAIGIRTEWVDAMTFGLGSGIAGIAGVALSQLTNVGPNLGQAYIIDSFMVVVFGGVGNLWGTLVGGMSLGLVNKFLEPATGAVLANILVLVFIILFIQKRPRGLFPQKGRAAES
ncbi:MAG: urea ABC transporter permease subunit UrtB [Pseudomonadales bacterium]|nr:urea ABC transporter permease subunit UrtB [Pseudomonadales bacterium]